MSMDLRTHHSPGGRLLLDVHHPSLLSVEARPVDLVAGLDVIKTELTCLRDAGTTLDIHAEAELAAEDMTLSHTLRDTETDSIPMTRSTKPRNQGVTAITPGVLRDSMGDLHVNGSAVEGTNRTVDGFTVAGPASGRLEMSVGRSQ